jgi:hypothetical protein
MSWLERVAAPFRDFTWWQRLLFFLFAFGAVEVFARIGQHIVRNLCKKGSA